MQDFSTWTLCGGAILHPCLSSVCVFESGSEYWIPVLEAFAEARIFSVSAQRAFSGVVQNQSLQHLEPL